MSTLVDLWPVAGLRVTCGDLSLEFLNDARLVALADLGAQGIHGPDFLPFANPWTRGTPAEVTRRILTYQWEARTKIAPEKWQIELALVRDGEVLGVQGASATDFPVGPRGRVRPWRAGASPSAAPTGPHRTAPTSRSTGSAQSVCSSGSSCPRPTLVDGLG